MLRLSTRIFATVTHISRINKCVCALRIIIIQLTPTNYLSYCRCAILMSPAYDLLERYEPFSRFHFDTQRSSHRPSVTIYFY